MPDNPNAALAIAGLVVLTIGAVMGLVSRRMLGRASTLSAPAAVVAGIVGSVLGGVSAHLLTGSPRIPDLVPIVLLSLVGTLAVLRVAEMFKPRPETPLPDLLAAGESARVEFKSTARHNLRTGERDARMEAVIAKTLAAFLNSEGGTLLIGVADDGRVLGLEDDLRHMKSPDLDRYELWLHDFLTRSLGAPAVARLAVSFPIAAGRAVCRVDASASPRPVFVTGGKGPQVSFYARIGNSTRELGVADAIDYAADHFHGSRGRRRARLVAQRTS